MSRALEILLRQQFIIATRNYVVRFPRSFDAYGFEPSYYDELFEKYAACIDDNAEAIYRGAAREMGQYIHDYKVHVQEYADEFKLVYYLGRAIERHLIRQGHIDAAKVHMFSLLEMLVFRLRTKGIFKKELTTSIASLIREGHEKLNEELGRNGLYLVFKCVSTTVILKPPGSEALEAGNA